MNKHSGETFANECQKNGVGCCKKGHIFIPEHEYDTIVHFLSDHGTKEDLYELQARSSKKEGYFLYDQKTRCQFLDDGNLCRLHESRIKPSECFWWPFHVYLGSHDQLEIRVAKCCSGCNYVEEEHLNQIKKDVKRIGTEIIKRFRKVHSYGEDYKVVGNIK